MFTIWAVFVSKECFGYLTGLFLSVRNISDIRMGCFCMSGIVWLLDMAVFVYQEHFGHHKDCFCLSGTLSLIGRSVFVCQEHFCH